MFILGTFRWHGFGVFMHFIKATLLDNADLLLFLGTLQFMMRWKSFIYINSSLVNPRSHRRIGTAVDQAFILLLNY
jgi:hypothetical protein